MYEVNDVFKRLKNLYSIEKNDEKAVKNAIEKCIEWGFSKSDTFKWVKCTEEVSPELDENLALARMKSIGMKYESYRKGRK